MRASFGLFLTLTLVGGTASAQIALTVPKGKFRFDLIGRFESFDRRWNDGTREEWAQDFDRTLDRLAVPELGLAEARLQAITGQTDISLSLGRSSARQLVNLGTAAFGLAYGLGSRLTLFGVVPLVQAQARTVFDVDGENATAGFTTPGASAAFLAQLSGAMADLETLIDDGTYSGDPDLQTLAVATLAQGRALEMNLVELFGSTGRFAPRAGTAIGDALLAPIVSLQSTLLGSLGVSGFTALPTLPSDGATSASLLDYVSGPLGADPLADVPELQYLGDVELGAVWSLVDTYPRSTLGGGIRSALETTFRLRTSQLDSPHRFLDVGTGDRQPDLEVNLVTDIGLGRYGLRLNAGYNLQLPGTATRRVAAPGQLAPLTSLADVRRDPGDVVRLGARPFIRLAPSFAAVAAVDYWRRGIDQYEYAAGQTPIPDVDVGVLATGSQSSAILLGAGLAYSHSGLNRTGEQRLPLDASLRYERVVSSRTGRVADSHVVRFELRLYGKLFR